MYVLISLIVFTDKNLEHIWTFYTNGISLHFNCIQIHNNKDSSWEHKHYKFNKQLFNQLDFILTDIFEIVPSLLFIDLFRHTYMSPIHHIKKHLSLTFVVSHLLSQRLVKVSTTLLLELSIVLVRLAVRYLDRSLPNPIPCVLDIPEVLVEDTKQPRFLPWEFGTLLDSVLNCKLAIFFIFSRFLVGQQKVCHTFTSQSRTKSYCELQW